MQRTKYAPDANLAPSDPKKTPANTLTRTDREHGLSNISFLRSSLLQHVQDRQQVPVLELPRRLRSASSLQRLRPLRVPARPGGPRRRAPGTQLQQVSTPNTLTVHAGCRDVQSITFIM